MTLFHKRVRLHEEHQTFSESLHLFHHSNPFHPFILPSTHHHLLHLLAPPTMVEQITTASSEEHMNDSAIFNASENEKRLVSLLLSLSTVS